MTAAANKAVTAHRRRRKERGLARIELHAPREDAPLLRQIAEALADPVRGPQTRRLLRETFTPYAGMNLKELLAAAPSFEELDLERNPDTGRDIEL